MTIDELCRLLEDLHAVLTRIAGHLDRQETGIKP